MLQGILYAGIYPLSIAIAINENSKATGTIIGICLSVALASPLIIQPLTGYLAEYSGGNSIVYVILASAILCFVFILILFKLCRYKDKNKKLYLY